MRKKCFVSLCVAIAAAFCFAGCRSDYDTDHVELIDESSWQTTTVVELTIAVDPNEEELEVDTDIVSETLPKKEKNYITTEFEITEYSFEDVISDFEIDDIKIPLPCSFEELNKHFNLDDKYLYYDEAEGKNCFSYAVDYTDDIYIRILYYSDLSDLSDENKLTADEMYCFYVWVENEYNDSCSFGLGQINNSMTRDDVEKVLGRSNVDISVDSRYVFNDYKKVVIDYDQNGYVNCIDCFLNNN